MSIKFNYEIVSCNEEAGVMEVRYTSNGLSPQNISVRLPVEGESVDSVIIENVPMFAWESNGVTYNVPEEGSTGELEYADARMSEAEIVRSIRNAKLSETDWMVVKALESNNTVPVELKIYREELRNVPTQEGFPEVILWPVDPYSGSVPTV